MILNLIKNRKDNYRHQKESYQQTIVGRISLKNGGINQRSLQIGERSM
jgi:hypothetical protein